MNSVSLLDNEIKNYLKINLNETDENKNECINEIKLWLQLNNIKLSDKLILPYLRSCKYNLIKTKEKMEKCYYLQINTPEWFENRNPQLNKLNDLLKLGCFIPLKKLNNNQLVVIVRAAIHNPKLHKQDDIIKISMILLDLALMENELATIYGVIVIFDLNGITFGHANQLTTTIIKKCVSAWQCYYCRPKRMDVVNAPIYINVILNIFKSFMSEKLKKRVQVHYNGIESLSDIILNDVLPPEYGGSGDSLKETIDYWYEKSTHFEDIFN